MSERDGNREDGFAEERLIQATKNQIESENPPTACAVFNKLTPVSYGRDETLSTMVHVLARETNAMLTTDRAFDSAGHEHVLCVPPTLSDDE